MLGPYRQAALALAQALTGRRRLLRWTGLLVLTAGLAAILNAAVSSSPYWPVQLAGRWAWLSPGALYRLLLLAPVWGAWSMLALGQFHRPGQDCDAPAREFSGSVGPVTVAVALLLPLTGSLVMLNFLYPAHFVPPAAALAAALGGGTGIIRLTGGPDRRALLATNLLTQFGFLLAYLAVK
jgi:hypothetical protein